MKIIQDTNTNANNAGKSSMNLPDMALAFFLAHSGALVSAKKIMLDLRTIPARLQVLSRKYMTLPLFRLCNLMKSCVVDGIFKERQGKGPRIFLIFYPSLFLS